MFFGMMLGVALNETPRGGPYVGSCVNALQSVLREPARMWRSGWTAVNIVCEKVIALVTLMKEKYAEEQTAGKNCIL